MKKQKPTQNKSRNYSHQEHFSDDHSQMSRYSLGGASSSRKINIEQPLSKMNMHKKDKYDQISEENVSEDEVYEPT